MLFRGKGGAGWRVRAFSTPVGLGGTDQVNVVMGEKVPVLIGEVERLAVP